MRFLHIADLHFGKSIHGVSLIDHKDQIVWVERFLHLVDEVKPQAVVIAGDVYDRSSPSGDAVELLDTMLTSLSEKNIPVMMVAGNHDSGQKLAFGSNIFKKQNVYIAGNLEKELMHVEVTDEEGEVTFWLMPYLFPALVAQKLEEESIRDYQTAVERLLEAQNIDFSQRNVLVAHQNVTANGKEAERGGSESMVGGVGQIDYSAFDGFEYVALGHIHSMYPVGREEVRYAGSPLCYHFEEIKQKAKGPVLVEIGAKGEKVNIDIQKIEPLHPMREWKGTYEEVKSSLETQIHKNEYVRIVLTDQRVTPQAADYFRALLKGRDSILMELTSEYQEYRQISSKDKREHMEEKAVEELFVDFYRERKVDAEPEEKELEILHFAGEQMRRDIQKGKNVPEEATIQKLLDFVLGQEV